MRLKGTKQRTMRCDGRRKRFDMRAGPALGFGTLGCRAAALCLGPPTPAYRGFYAPTTAVSSICVACSVWVTCSVPTVPSHCSSTMAPRALSASSPARTHRGLLVRMVACSSAWSPAHPHGRLLICMVACSSAWSPAHLHGRLLVRIVVLLPACLRRPLVRIAACSFAVGSSSASSLVGGTDISIFGAELVSLFDDECGWTGQPAVPPGKDSHSFICQWNRPKFEQEVAHG